jgi:putative endonuclease
MAARLGITLCCADLQPATAPANVSADRQIGRMRTLKTMTRIQLGALGEALAVDHLTAMGLRILQRNWRCRYGELDVVACDDARATVVFVEVKTRTGDGFGGLPYAVTERKVRRLRRLAGLWLAGQNRRWAAVRVDVIGVRLGLDRAPDITHLQGIG